MGKKIPRHIVGGVALTNGVLLHAPDVAVLSFRDHDGEILTTFWNLPKEKPAPKWLHYFGIRGLWLLWRTIWWNSRVRTFVASHTKSILKEYGYEKGHKNAPSTTLFPFLGVVVAVLLYLEVVWAIYLVGDFQRGWDAVTRSDLTVFIFTALIIVYLVWKGGIWQYMGYHGAEHQAIRTLEDGGQAHHHWAYQPRCGAAVISYVAILLALIGWFSWIQPFWILIIITLALFSLSYELVLVLDRYSDQYWAEFLSLPGVILQLLVVRKPTREQSDVADDALRILKQKSTFLNSQFIADETPLT